MGVMSPVMAQPVNWLRAIDTLETSMKPYDVSFQQFARISAALIAHTCKQPGDSNIPTVSFLKAGSFRIPSNTESACQTIREEGFGLQCVGIDSATVQRIPSFERFNPSLPLNYYTTTSWTYPSTMPDAMFQCHFGKKEQSVFMQSYLGPAFVLWTKSPKMINIQTSSGTITHESQSVTLMANIPGVQGALFSHTLMALKK